MKRKIEDEQDAGWSWSCSGLFLNDVFPNLGKGDIAYKFQGSKASFDICAGKTLHWTQRHNPFLYRQPFIGIPVNGSRCYNIVSRFIQWTAEHVVYVSENIEDSTCTLFQFFKSSTVYGCETKTPPEMFKSISLAIFGKDNSLMTTGHDVAFRIRHQTQVHARSLRSFDFSAHDSFVFLTLPITGDDGLCRESTCCEAHRTLDHVVNTIFNRERPAFSLKKPSWFYAPLSWFEIVCGVCKEDIDLLPDGHHFEEIIPSEFRFFQDMISKGEKDAEVCLCIPEQLDKLRRRDEALFLRVCPLLHAPLCKYEEYAFVNAVTMILPYRMRSAFYETILWLTQSEDTHVRVVSNLLRYYRQREDVIRECLGHRLRDVVSVVLLYDHAPHHDVLVI